MATLAGLAACRGGGTDNVVRLRIDRGSKDSTAFKAPASAHVCRGGGAIIDAVDGGNGVLAWIKGPAAPTAGTYPLLGRADSSSTRGTVVSVRFIWHDVAHGFDVDSGTLTLTTAGPWYRGRIQGAGTDLGLATRTTVSISLDSIRTRPDTVACGAAP